MEKTKKITAHLIGIRPILFDRYVGMKEVMSWVEKAYEEDGVLVMPSINIMSFLSSANTESATQRVVGRGWKQVAKAAMSFVIFSKLNFQINTNGRPAVKSDLILHRAVARVKKGSLSIPSEKERPMLEEWDLNIEMELLKNPDLSEETLKRIFIDGGFQVGLGTFRGLYGKFEVENWITA